MRVNIHLSKSAGCVLVPDGVALSKRSAGVYGPLVACGQVWLSRYASGSYWQQTESEVIYALLQRQDHVLLGTDEVAQLFGEEWIAGMGPEALAGLATTGVP